MTPQRTITLQPRVLKWARVRNGLQVEDVAKRVSVKPERVRYWEESGEISFAQIRNLAAATHTPEGYLYLPEPSSDELPISDLRTSKDRRSQHASPNLLATIRSMQRRQEWLRGELIEDGSSPLEFVGSVSIENDPKEAGAEMRTRLGLSHYWASERDSWKDAFNYLRGVIESIGVIVVSNGVVGNNTSRKLNAKEFRGFALVDPYAPLIFINNDDFKSAQMFTVVHELAHIWLGTEGVSNVGGPSDTPTHRVELFCNRAAAEFLVPEEELRQVWIRARGDFNFVARYFKVSSLVAARCAWDLDLIDEDTFFKFYQSWESTAIEDDNDSGGGNFWNTQNSRVGKRFGSAVARAVKEGRLLYRDAYALTDISKGSTFSKFERLYGPR